MHERRFIFACAVLVLAACGNSNGGADSGPLPVDSGPAMLPAAMVDTDDDDIADAPADFACVGSAMAPTAGASAEFMAHLYDFQSGPSSMVPSIGVDIFADNVVTPGCSGSCTTVMADAMGDLSFMANTGGWFAYRIHAGTMAGPTNPVLTIGYNRTAEGATIALPSVSSQTIGFIPSLYLRDRVPGTGIISGNVSDCDGNPVEGAILRVFRGDTEIVPGPARGDFFIGYFNGSVPAARRTFTDPGGIYASANVQATTEPVRVEVYAAESAGGAPRIIACEEVQMYPDAVTIISVGPVRNDYASGSGCAGRI